MKLGIMSELVLHQERSDEPKRMVYISENRLTVEGMSLDSANARAKRWKERYEDSCKQVARVEELIDNLS
jgi:hypothetical protein